MVKARKPTRDFPTPYLGESTKISNSSWNGRVRIARAVRGVARLVFGTRAIQIPEAQLFRIG